MEGLSHTDPNDSLGLAVQETPAASGTGLPGQRDHLLGEERGAWLWWAALATVWDGTEAVVRGPASVPAGGRGSCLLVPLTLGPHWTDTGPQLCPRPPPLSGGWDHISAGSLLWTFGEFFPSHRSALHTMREFYHPLSCRKPLTQPGCCHLVAAEGRGWPWVSAESCFLGEGLQKGAGLKALPFCPMAIWHLETVSPDGGLRP